MTGDAAGWTPLHKAARIGAQNAVRALIQAGASIEARASITGRTPLHEACSYMRPETVDLLLRMGADENARDNDGRNPVDVTGQWLADGESAPEQEQIRVMMERAPADRIWRRRRWLVLLRWRLPLIDVAEEEQAGVDDVRFPPYVPCAVPSEESGISENGIDLNGFQREDKVHHTPISIPPAVGEKGESARNGGVPCPPSPQLTTAPVSVDDSSQDTVATLPRLEMKSKYCRLPTYDAKLATDSVSAGGSAVAQTRDGEQGPKSDDDVAQWSRLQQEKGVRWLISSTVDLPDGVFREVVLLL